MDDSLGLSMKQSGWASARVLNANSEKKSAHSSTWRSKPKSNQRFKTAPSMQDSASAQLSSKEIENNGLQSSLGTPVATTTAMTTTPTVEPEWTNHLEQLIVLFSEKCARRVMLHREAARYFEQRVRWLTVPSTVLGVVSGSAVFATWQQQFCGAEWHQYINLGIGVAMLLSTALSTILAKSDYQALYAAHLQSYQDYDNLMRDLNVELCFEPEFRQPVRKVVNSMLKRYKELTNFAKLIPSRVDRALAKTIQNAANAPFISTTAATASAGAASSAPTAATTASEKEASPGQLESQQQNSASTRAYNRTEFREFSATDSDKTRQTVVLTEWLRNTLDDLEGKESIKNSSSSGNGTSSNSSNNSSGANCSAESEKVLRRPSMFCKTMPASSMIEMTFLPQFAASAAQTSAPVVDSSSQNVQQNLFFSADATVAKKEETKNVLKDERRTSGVKKKQKRKNALIPVAPLEDVAPDLVASHAKLVSQAMQQTADNTAQSSQSSPLRPTSESV